MSDLIDRQEAIDALDEQIRQCDKALSAFDISMKDEYAVKVERASLVAFRETLEYMPSAQPERIKGHWVNGRCDKCNEHAPFWAMASTYHESNFCPNCGAEMEVTT